MSDELEQGLYRKYIVTKVNGEPVPPINFVLRPETDLTARVALKAYGQATPNKTLARDIHIWLGMLARGER